MYHAGAVVKDVLFAEDDVHYWSFPLVVDRGASR